MSEAKLKIDKKISEAAQPRPKVVRPPKDVQIGIDGCPACGQYLDRQDGPFTSTRCDNCGYGLTRATV